jgi:hypothetical protein
VVQEGHASFTVSDATIEAIGGQIAVIPAYRPWGLRPSTAAPGAGAPEDRRC